MISFILFYTYLCTYINVGLISAIYYKKHCSYQTAIDELYKLYIILNNVIDTVAIRQLYIDYIKMQMIAQT